MGCADCHVFSEEAEAAERSAGQQHPERIEPRAQHDGRRRHRHRGGRWPRVGGPGHHRPAGDHEPNGHGNKAFAHCRLPWRAAEAVPEAIGRQINRAGRSERRHRTDDGAGKAPDLPTDEPHHQDHVRSRYRLSDREELAEILVGHPAMGGDDEVPNIGENGWKPAETDGGEEEEMSRQRERRGRGVHRARCSRPATPMLSGSKPKRTTSSGSLPTAMRPKASPAKIKVAARPRCGISILIPVAIRSPAAVADSPPRMLRRRGRCACWRSTTPSVKPRAHGINRNPATAASVPRAPRSLAPVHTAMPMMFGPGMNWQRLTMSANSCSLSHWRCSTPMRRAQTRPPPPPMPNSETLRNATNKAPSGTTSSACSRFAALAIYVSPDPQSD